MNTKYTLKKIQRISKTEFLVIWDYNKQKKPIAVMIADQGSSTTMDACGIIKDKNGSISREICFATMRIYNAVRSKGIVQARKEFDKVQYLPKYKTPGPALQK